MLPDSHAHEGHNHGPAEAAPRQAVPSEQPPGVVNTPPPFETLENAPVDPRAIPERSEEREPAPSSFEKREPYDRQFQTIEPPATFSGEYDDRPRLRTAPRALEQHPRDRQLAPRTYEDARAHASPVPECGFGCPLDDSSVGGYSSSLPTGDTWSCPQSSESRFSTGPRAYHYSDELDCHTFGSSLSYGLGPHGHGYSCSYGDHY